MFLARWFMVALSVLCLLTLPPSAASTQTRGIGGVVRFKDGGSIKLYDDYQALVIGVGDYEHWPKLPGAVQDAKEVARVLRDLGFKVKLVLNPTSAQLIKLLDELPYDLGFKHDRGLLIYFAGHGETEDLANKKKLGYIVPTDSPLMTSDPRGFTRTAVSMSDMEDLALRIKSRHVLMAFDSCFSGSIFALGRAAPAYITRKVAQPVRQFITAGNEEETVPDRSLFKRVFVDGIQGEADHDRDGYITGSELGSYLQKHVVTYTNDAQHPQFGRIRDPDLDKGDFVFVLAGGTDTGPDLRQQRIDNLLKEADALFSRNDLTTPQGANALERYNQVLRLDPLNSRAYSGKKKIVGKYVEWARSRCEAGNYSRAERFLSSAEKVSEHDVRVWRLGEQIRKAKQKASADAERKKREELARQQAAEEATRKARLEKERQAKAEAASKEQARKEAKRKRQQATQSVERSSDGRYSKDSQGVITDSRTGLQWYVGPDRDTNWYDAKKWMEGLNVAGGGWRMPSRSELRGLYQKDKGSRNMDPIFQTSGWWVWLREANGASDAWDFHFADGGEGWGTRPSGYGLGVFAVRKDTNNTFPGTPNTTVNSPKIKWLAKRVGPLGIAIPSHWKEKVTSNRKSAFWSVGASQPPEAGVFVIMSGSEPDLIGDLVKVEKDLVSISGQLANKYSGWSPGYKARATFMVFRNRFDSLVLTIGFVSTSWEEYRGTFKAIHRSLAVNQSQATPRIAGSTSGSTKLTMLQQIYSAEVNSRIKRQWVLPNAYAKETSKLVAWVALRIKRDGHLAQISLEQSSGNSLFDHSCLRAVKKAAPFAPFPELSAEQRGKPLELTIRFNPSETW